jgi:hypothetical protein
VLPLNQADQDLRSYLPHLVDELIDSCERRILISRRSCRGCCQLRSDGMDSVAGCLPEDLRRLVSEAKWTYAKAMPRWPHEYIVRQQVDGDLFERLVRHIRSNGFEGRFYSRRLIYYEADGLLYWTMGAPLDETTIVNRCKKEDSCESRLRSGTLPK